MSILGSQVAILREVEEALRALDEAKLANDLAQVIALNRLS